MGNLNDLLRNLGNVAGSGGSLDNVTTQQVYDAATSAGYGFAPNSNTSNSSSGSEPTITLYSQTTNPDGTTTVNPTVVDSGSGSNRTRTFGSASYPATGTSAQYASLFGGTGSTSSSRNSSSNLGGGSDGSNFGSVGAGYNPGGATYQYDSAGNRIIGKLGGKNVITGGGGVDRTAGVTGQMGGVFDPSYWVNREQDIRKQVERERQGQIDAINQRYEGQVRREEEAGQQDLARQRSMNLRAGLGGSDFGAANKAEVRNRTANNVRDIQANQDIAVGQVIDQIETIANQRYQNEFTVSNQTFQNQMAYAQFQQTQQQNARNLIKELGGAGLDMATIKTRDPQLYESITSSAGIGEVQAEYLMNTARKAAEKIDYQWQVVGNKVLGYGVDPRTGELKQVAQDLAVDIPKNYGVSFAPDGTMMMVPDQFDPSIPAEQQIIFGANYSKPEASGGYSNQMLDNERALMTSFKGEQIVKNYNDVVNKANSVQGIIDGGMGGPGDLAVVFEFMKALDPTSVVRESEYEAASKSGNIFAGAWTRFNKGYFDPKGGILPEQVKSDFMKAINVKLEVAQKQYENVANEYSQIAQRQGLDPRNVVIGYGNAFTGQDSELMNDPEVQAAVSAPIGSVVYLNGKPYKKLGDDNYQELSSISAPQ